MKNVKVKEKANSSLQQLELEEACKKLKFARNTTFPCLNPEFSSRKI